MSFPIRGQQLELELRPRRWLIPQRRAERVRAPRDLLASMGALQRPIVRAYLRARMLDEPQSLRAAGAVSLRLAALALAVGLDEFAGREARWAIAVLAEAAQRPGGRRRRPGAS